jgi:hypothetical protein
MNYLTMLIMAAPLALGQIKAPVELQIPVLTACEILSQRMDYNGKLVSIRARIHGTDEGVWLDGRDCPGLITSDEYVWPSMISTQTSDADFTSSFEGMRKLRPKLMRLGRRAPERCIIWTYTGVFETRSTYEKVSYPNGSSTYIGFGHLGAAPAQLLLKTVDDVNIYRSENANEKVANFRIRNGCAGRGLKQEVTTWNPTR